MNNIEVIKIEMGHADPAMYEQIDALTEGELVEWSIDYFQELSRLGYFIYVYFRERGTSLTKNIIIEDGCVDGVDAGRAFRH